MDYPKSNQGGLWKNTNASEENRQPPYRGHIVITGEMLQTLVTLFKNNAWQKDGPTPDLGPRINIAAWLNTSRDSGEKYFRLASDVYFSSEHDGLFASQPSAPVAEPVSTPVVNDDLDADIPF